MLINMLLLLIFFVIALTYSMVGFGGGSSYLAVLVLAGYSYQQIPTTALICNLIVAGGGFWYFHQGGHFQLKKVLPFIILSIPMAYLGGSMKIGKELFSLLLGLSLLAMAVRMILPEKLFETQRFPSWQKTWGIGIPLGALLGFLSGLVGIGGGIFLSPLLILMRWVTVKQAGASASFFILVNSLAGLVGQFQKGFGVNPQIGLLGLVVFLGGQIGAIAGTYRLSKLAFQRLLTVLVLSASMRLLWRGLG